VGKTQHYGLNTFGAEGRISDEGYKFSLRDRELIDTLFHTLAIHNHSGASAGIQGPPSSVYLDLSLEASGGTIPAGRDYYYKFSYVDANGNETQASSAILISTPDPLIPPTTTNLTTATTGGSLAPGTYKYALAFYQDAGGVTTAPNISTITVPQGTSTNTVTIPLEDLPADADGWRIFRRGPGDLEYWLLAAVASGPTEYVDDGTVSPDCTKKRPQANTTNSTNSIVIDLPATELPLSPAVTAWKIYRASNPGSYPTNSLVATVVETTTEGGSDLVTTHTDTGGALNPGIPLGQTSVPDAPPPLDASTAFDLLGDRLPSVLAPLGVHAFNLLLPSTLAVQDYHQFTPPFDMPVERIDGFFLTAPTGLSGTDFLTVRFSDAETKNEVQALYNDAEPLDEIQSIYIENANGGTFTLSDGVDTTSAIAFDATAETIETRLETDIASITDVIVSGSGTQIDPWVITFIDPGGTNVPQLIGDDDNLDGVGAASVITTIREGQDGGTFTLSDGTDTTSAIDYNAAAATIKTRLETDITSITTVNVTGTGVFADPWLIEFVDPGAQDVALLIVNDTNLDGNSFISEQQRGHGITEADLTIDANQQAHSWQASTTKFDSQEAEEAPAVGGEPVSDNLALSNSAAAELDTQNEENYWNVGTLDPGSYIAYFWVSDVNKTASFDIEVVDDHLGTPTLIESQSLTPARSVYTPAYELRFTSTGTEDIFFVTTKTDAGAGLVRIDKYEYEFEPLTLHGGSLVTVEVLVDGSPTTNGDDLQVTLWY
jgi:hypothetical protein